MDILSIHWFSPMDSATFFDAKVRSKKYIYCSLFSKFPALSFKKARFRVRGPFFYFLRSPCGPDNIPQQSHDAMPQCTIIMVYFPKNSTIVLPLTGKRRNFA